MKNSQITAPVVVISYLMGKCCKCCTIGLSRHVLLQTGKAIICASKTIHVTPHVYSRITGISSNCNTIRGVRAGISRSLATGFKDSIALTDVVSDLVVKTSLQSESIY